MSSRVRLGRFGRIVAALILAGTVLGDGAAARAAALTSGDEESAGKAGQTTPPPGCHVDATTLCLNNGRFRVRAFWETADGSSGNAQAAALTSDAGYFTFFSAANVELVVKVLNGCDFNSSYWVFASGLTDVHVFVRVVDVTNGDQKLYENPLGTAFQSIQDTSAFARCP
jgi:hypothetical protein